MISVGLFDLRRTGMRIDKHLHQADRLLRIGLIQMCLGRLPVISIGPHILHFLSLGAVGEYFCKLFEQVFRLQLVVQIIGAISKFIKDIFKLRLPFE